MRVYFRFLAPIAFAFCSLAAQAQTQTTIPLVAGWNLIGNGNAAILNVANATLFGDLTRVATVWKWVPAISKWAFYAPSLTSPELSNYALSKGYDVLATIAGGEGFWVNAKTPFSVSLPNGPPVLASSFQSSLLPGWSLIAIGESKGPSEFNRLLNATPSASGTDPLNVTTLWAWESSQSLWYFYAPSLMNSGGLAAYAQSKGYLDFTAASKKLGPGVGFWVNKPDTTTSTAAATTTSTAATTTTTSTTTTTTIALAPPTGVSVSNSATQTVGSLTFSSSTKLSVSWTAPGYSVDHYVISALEAIQNTAVTTIAAASSTSATLIGLKSATPYSVSVKACANSACASVGSAAAVSATTSNEVWQVQDQGIGGVGNTWNQAQKIIADGNTKAWAFAYGSGAGSGLEGTTRLFYDPDFSDKAQKGVKVGYTTSVATTNPSSVKSFTPATGYGLRFVRNTNNYTIDTSMPVPLSAAMGGKIRLFMEFSYTAPGNKVGIYYIDSEDGYTGLDYNKGSATVCSTDDEFAVGGNCAPTLAVGGNSQSSTGIDTARQFKIGYPILTDWRWNGDPGTFMVFSMNTATGACSSNAAGMGYAQWDGSKWSVTNVSGCPKYWEHMQAPVPLHLGGVKYKMYYGHADLSDTSCSSSSPTPGSKKVLYADGAVSGSATTVEFEDWEAKDNQRDITFLWPDGTELDSCSEKKFDDFAVYMPTFSTDYQVMYMVNENSWIAMAVLLNP